MVVVINKRAFQVITPPNYANQITVFIPLGLNVSGTGAITFTITNPVFGAPVCYKNGSFFATTTARSTNPPARSFTTSSTGTFAFTRLTDLYIIQFTPTYENATNTYELYFSYNDTSIVAPLQGILMNYTLYTSLITSGTFSSFPANFTPTLNAPLGGTSLSAYIETPYLPAGVSSTKFLMLDDLLITNKIMYDNGYIDYNNNSNGYTPINFSASGTQTLTFPLSEFYIVSNGATASIITNIKLPDITGIDLPNFTYRFKVGGVSNTMRFVPYYVDVAPPATASPFFNVNLPLGTTHNGTAITVAQNVQFVFNATTGTNYAFGLQIRNGNWFVYV